MRLTLFLVFISLMQVFSTNTYSQSAKISVNLKNSAIKEVLYNIESISGYYFLFNSQLVDVERKVDIVVSNEKVEQVLDKIFEGQDIGYTIMDCQIIIQPSSMVGKNNMQQSKSILGKVTDSSGTSLPGVTVVVKGTSNGIITDMDGKYKLPNVPSDAILVFSFVGMKTQEISVAGKSSIDVVLEEDAIGIEEVVAIGYGTMRKSDLTGSVVSVKSEDLNTFPTNNAIQALQGRAGGVQIQSANGGEPGRNYNILIRGGSSVNASSSPLYVIDGFPDGILPSANDIESVEILKDASATAIYGSRGANGVVLITTKKGFEGKMKINLNASYSVQNDTKRYDLLDAQQFGEIVNKVSDIRGVAHVFENPSLLGKGTDWQDMVLQTGHIQNYNLSISGGADKINYYISGVYYDQKGIVINSNFKKYSITSNINIKATEKMKVGIDMFISRNDNDKIVTQKGTGGGAMNIALLFPSTVPVYEDDGSYAVRPASLGESQDNPVAQSNENTKQILNDYMEAKVFGEFSLLKNLKYKLVVGAQTQNSREGNYASSKLLYNDGGEASISTSKGTKFLVDNYFTYAKKFGSIHNLTVMAGISYQSYSSEYSVARATTFLTDATSWWNLGGSSVFEQPGSGLTESVLKSYFGRVNYGLKDRYMFTFNSRYDGSSRFAANNKWAFFPSGAFAWNIYKENFMSGLKNISQLKLRTSYGVTGNQAIDPYQSLARLSSVFSVVNATVVNAVRQSTVANDNLTWESTAQTDIGIDLGLFRNKLIINADYYNKKTSDLLFEVPLPLYSSFSTQLKNIGEIRNRGFEFSLQVNNVIPAIKWDTKFNLSLNRNKVLKLPNNGEDIFYTVRPGQFVGVNNSQILREGEPLGAFYGYIYEGVQQEGDELLIGAEGIGGERFKDVHADGELTAEDRTVIGNPNPDFYWGWSNDFEFKNFFMNVFFQGVQGNDMLNYTRMELELSAGTNNTTTEILNSWTPTNTNTDVPVIADRAQKLSSRWIEDASFIRLENVTLGYIFPKRTLEKLKLGSMRIYISGQKLLTFTKYKGFDPEVSWSRENMNIGLDYDSYPNTRSLTMGLSVEF